MIMKNGEIEVSVPVDEVLKLLITSIIALEKKIIKLENKEIKTIELDPPKN